MLDFSRIIKDSPFFKRLQHEQSNIVNCLINGNLQDFAEYRYYQGQIVGLQKAIDLLEEFCKQDESTYEE